ncbi:O-antigen polymerase [Paraclostridium sordellii]|uniref:Oligosaccharide repeat unit polymerase n=1 Tax=Paraclostridium sordellii TaxID=1505 RepID=A0A9P1L2R6_PARSO|nr:O-antigen polymerase [Paeniclostridium sordellii]CEO33564.1 Uncharacterised protein [[Clostridium] sordellii] [Paeniclostridium sordellii]
MVSVLFLYSILIFLTSRIFMKSYICPYSIFLGVFAFSGILLYSSNFLSKDLTSLSITIFVLSMLTFAIGAMIALFDQKLMKYNKEFVDIDYDKLYFIIKILFNLSIIGFLIYFIKLNSSFGLINILKNPVILNTAIANDQIQSGIKDYLMILSIPNSLLLLKYMSKNKEKSYLKIMYLIELGMNFNVKRSRLFYIVILNLFMYLFMNLKEGNIVSIKSKVMKDIKNFIMVLGVIIVSFNLFSKLQMALNKQLSITGTILGINASESVVSMVTYFSGNLVSMGQMINIDYNNILFGTATFRFIYKFLDKINIVSFDDSYLKMQFVNIPSPFNTVPIQYYIYRDFNIIGVVLFFFIIGYLSTKIYLKFLRGNNEFTIFYLSLICMILTLSIREYVVIFIEFWVILLTLIISNIYAKNKGKCYNK